MGLERPQPFRQRLGLRVSQILFFVKFLSEEKLLAAKVRNLASWTWLEFAGDRDAL